MNKILILLLGILFAVVACDKSPIEKPEILLKEKQMIDILVDIHLAEATFNARRISDENVKNSSSADFYYSILEKYQLPDSVFEKSFVYYASMPKNFEKMYRKVMNKLSEIEQSYSGRKDEILDFEDPE